jgi:hypothetical protein
MTSAAVPHGAPAGTPADVERTLALLHPAGTTFEVRALGIDKRRIAVGYFTEPGDAASAVARLGDEWAGIYVTLNPCRPELLARAANRIKISGEATRDPEIARRCTLLLDFDCVRPAGISATDAERAAAADLAAIVGAYLMTLGWPAPAEGDSGNGYHLLFRIDMPNDADADRLVKRVLLALAHRFDTGAVKVDTTVSNASRISKLYGTWARKGDSIPDRPHRVSRLLAVPEPFEAVGAELLAAVAADAPGPARGASPVPQGRGLVLHGNALHERARAYLARMPRPEEGNGSDTHTFRAACALVNDLGVDDGAAVRLLEEWSGFEPEWLAAKVAHARRYAKRPEGRLRDAERTRSDLRGARPARVDVGPGLDDVDEAACRTCGRDSCEDHQPPTREPDKPMGLRFVRVSEVGPSRVSWAWSRRLPFGKLTILDGDPGLGKSTLVADLIARWTQGHSLPGETLGRSPFAVTMICAEDGVSDTIRPRLEVAGADLARVVVIKGLPVFPAQLVELESTVRETQSLAIILDPGLAFIDPDLDAHADAEARRYAAGLADLAERTGAAAIFIRHLNKASGSSALYRGGGSIAFAATARSVLLVATSPEDPAQRILAPTKCNLCAAPPTLLFRVVASGPEEPGRVVWEGETGITAGEALAAANDQRRAVSTAKRSGLMALLRDLLADGPVSVTKVAAALRDSGVAGDDPLSHSSVKAARRALRIQSHKTGWSDWYWALPDVTR